MSFWRTFGFHAVSAIDSLLEQSDVTLEQLLEEDDLLQETKSQNKKLIDFLCQPETLQKLIRYITVKTEHEDDPKLAIKYPFLACEVLASEVWSIYDAIANDTKLMESLYSIFEKDPPLDIQLSAYAARVAVILLQKKVTETVNFLREKKEIVEHFLKHLGNPAVMDLLLKLISCEDPQTGNSGALEWLQKTNLIKSLISKFKSTNTPETHENVAHTLVEIIKIGPNAGPLIEQLESKAILEELFSYMMENKNGSELSYGVNVLMALVMRHSKDTYTENVSVDQLSEPIAVILAHIEALAKSLNSPTEKSEPQAAPVENNNSESKQEKPEAAPESGAEVKPGKEEVKETPQTPLPASVLNFVGKKKLKSTVGDIEPVGFCRLKLVEFFSCLARTNIQLVDKAMAEKAVFKKCIELFFAHPWNNFLHASVESMIRGALESPNEDLKAHILKDCALLDKIVANNKLNNDICSKPKGMRLGNMGHITALVFVISEMGQHGGTIEKIVSEHADWAAYSKAIMETSVNVNNSFGFTQELTNEDNMEEMSGQFSNQPTFTHFTPFMNPDFTNDDNEEDPNAAMENDYEPNAKFEHGMFAQFKANSEDSDDSEESEDEDGDGVVVTQTETLEEDEDIVSEVLDDEPKKAAPQEEVHESASPEKEQPTTPEKEPSVTPVETDEQKPTPTTDA